MQKYLVGKQVHGSNKATNDWIIKKYANNKNQIQFLPYNHETWSFGNHE